MRLAPLENPPALPRDGTFDATGEADTGGATALHSPSRLAAASSMHRRGGRRRTKAAALGDAALGAAELGVGLAIRARKHARWIQAGFNTAVMLLAGLALWKGNWYLNWCVDARACAFLYYFGLGLLRDRDPDRPRPDRDRARILSRRGGADASRRALPRVRRVETSARARARRLWERGSARGRRAVRRLRRRQSSLEARWRIAPGPRRARRPTARRA